MWQQLKTNLPVQQFQRNSARIKISRRNLAAKNSSRGGSNPISRQNYSFPLQNVRDSNTAHTAVKGMGRRVQHALARKELLRNTPETRENAPSKCALSSTILYS